MVTNRLAIPRVNIALVKTMQKCVSTLPHSINNLRIHNTGISYDNLFMLKDSEFLFFLAKDVQYSIDYLCTK